MIILEKLCGTGEMTGYMRKLSVPVSAGSTGFIVLISITEEIEVIRLSVLSIMIIELRKYLRNFLY